jgi:hypothetical protein
MVLGSREGGGAEEEPGDETVHENRSHHPE